MGQQTRASSPRTRRHTEEANRFPHSPDAIPQLAFNPDSSPKIQRTARVRSEEYSTHANPTRHSIIPAAIKQPKRHRSTSRKPVVPQQPLEAGATALTMKSHRRSKSIVDGILQDNSAARFLEDAIQTKDSAVFVPKDDTKHYSFEDHAEPDSVETLSEGRNLANYVAGILCWPLRYIEKLTRLILDILGINKIYLPMAMGLVAAVFAAILAWIWTGAGWPLHPIATTRSQPATFHQMLCTTPYIPWKTRLDCPTKQPSVFGTEPAQPGSTIHDDALRNTSSNPYLFMHHSEDIKEARLLIDSAASATRALLPYVAASKMKPREEVLQHALFFLEKADESIANLDRLNAESYVYVLDIPIIVATASDSMAKIQREADTAWLHEDFCAWLWETFGAYRPAAVERYRVLTDFHTSLEKKTTAVMDLSDQMLADVEHLGEIADDIKYSMRQGAATLRHSTPDPQRFDGSLWRFLHRRVYEVTALLQLDTHNADQDILKTTGDLCKQITSSVRQSVIFLDDISRSLNLVQDNLVTILAQSESGWKQADFDRGMEEIQNGLVSIEDMRRAFLEEEPEDDDLA